MYLVKKYHNRKLYLPATTIEDKKIKGRYITSKQLLELDKEKGVKVIDNQTKSDITDETVLSAIYELAKVDSNVRSLILTSFSKEESFLTLPEFLFETIVTQKPAEEKPGEEIHILGQIDPEEIVPGNVPVAKPASEGFTGF